MKMITRKNIEPMCTYCSRSTPLDDGHVSCRHKGVVDFDYHCTRFKYDPLKRVPPKPARISRNFKDSDFTLE